MQAERLLQFGWKPHTTETRKAMKFAKPMALHRAGSLPRKWSLYHLCILLDQLALGSCTAQASAQVIRMACVAAGITDPVLISRLCAYYLARVRAGEATIDSGSQVGTVFDVLADGGCFPEWAWGYDITRFAEMPDTMAIQAGYDSRGTIGLDYAEITSYGNTMLDDIRKLARRWPPAMAWRLAPRSRPITPTVPPASSTSTRRRRSWAGMRKRSSATMMTPSISRSWAHGATSASPDKSQA